MRLTSKQKDARRALWMREFEEIVCSLKAEERGKIEWTSATYFFNAAFPAREAAEKYVYNRI